MRVVRLLSIVAAIVSLVTQAFAAPPPGYNLEWTEQFNEGVGGSPSSSIWGYTTGAGGFGNNELETYTSDNAHSHLIADANAEDGNALQIQATDDNGGIGTAGRYTSARINTSGKVLPEYGYIEARCQLPYGDGIWPAFWQLGSNIGSVGWPACGETDIMETIGDDYDANGNFYPYWLQTNVSSLHGPGYSGGNPLTARYSISSGYLYQAYHKYAMLWTPTQITFYFDDIPFETHTPADTNGNPWAYSGHTFYMIANIAVGGNWPGAPDAHTTFPQNLLIDYIKIYTLPFNGPHNIPGVIQADDFDNGGQSISYKTITNTNNGGAYRPELGVGIQPATGGGYDVGWSAGGQWMKYTVNVQSTGTYTATFRVSSGASGGSFHLEDPNGHALTGPIVVPGTGGWQNWVTVTSSISLTAGPQVIKLVEDTNNFNVDYMAFTSTSGAFDGPHNIPGVVQAEDYNQGGDGVGYHSLSTSGNPAAVFRNDNVTVENCAGGGYDVSSTAPGQWLKYNVNVSTGGLYNMAVKVAGFGGAFHIVDENGNNLTGTVTVPPTGGGQTWTAVDAIVNLTAGAHILQLVEDSGGFSIDSLSFTTGFNGPHVIPSTIAAVDYDQGGDGIGFADADDLNSGSSTYRNNDGVDMENSSLGGNNVGWTQAGQWLAYTVFAQVGGQYNATFTVASGANGGTLHLVDEAGNNLTGAVTVPATGGWQNWTTVTVPITLATGGHSLRLVEDSGGYNLYSIAFSATTNSVASVAVNPSTILAGGSSTATVTVTSPAAASTLSPDGQTIIAGQAVEVSSDNAAAPIVSGPSLFVGGAAYIVIPTGQTTGTFTVAASSTNAPPTTANLSGSINGVAQSAALTINPTAPTLTSLSPASTTAGVGTSLTIAGTGFGSSPTVTFGSFTLPVQSSTSSSITVAVPPADVPTAGSIPVTVANGTGAASNTLNFTVNPVVLSTVTISPTHVTGGQGATLTATLTGPAPAGGLVVTFSSNNTAVAKVATASVTVPAGSSTATCAVTTVPVASTTNITFTAKAGVSHTVHLNVLPPALSVFKFSPSKIVGGASGTGTITLNGVAAVNTTVTVTSSNGALTINGPVVVPAGSNTTTFTVNTTPVPANVSVTITASCGGTQASLTVTVKMPALTAATFSPTSVKGGSTSTLTVTLGSVAPAGGTAVTMTYPTNGSVLANPPSTITVPAGSTTASAVVQTSTVAVNTVVTANANLSTTNIKPTLTVTP